MILSTFISIDPSHCTLINFTNFISTLSQTTPTPTPGRMRQQLYLIIQMSTNKEEQFEECFINEQFEQISQTQPLDFKIEITKKINEQMPANELRAVQRPDNMVARTFYLDRPLFLLKQALNKPQNEGVAPVLTSKQKLRICNSSNLTIEQYFSRKKFQCVYNKLSTYRNDSKSFLGKLKGVDLLIDYNWKSFKELQIEIDLLNESQEERIDSDFESGNLCRAYVNSEVAEKEYYLLIQNDLNTYGYNNWFFFRFRNQEKGVRKLNIVNFIKKTNFFSQGMLVSIFSVKKHHDTNQGWHKGGDNIAFGAVNLLRQHHENEYYYSLCFDYDFQYENDEVYFALNQPYTYSRLVDFLDVAKEKPSKMKMEVKPIGYSISNNIIPVVRFYHEKSRSDQAILILGRQHPCETVGSFIAEKIINYFTSGQDAITSFLVSSFDIFVIPMINPDGVIHGMSRANMAGLDLNRHWGDNILKQLTPQTMKVKQFITTLSKAKKIKYMIDLHGHGKKLNSFYFCCKGNEKEKDNQLLTLCMKELESRFNLYGCTFGVTKDKENTVRSQMRNLGIKNSYTLETSLYGWKNDDGPVKHFNETDYDSIAKNLIKSIFLLQADADATYRELGLSKEAIIKQIPLILEISEREEKFTFQNSEIMSDSDPQGDRLDVKDLLGKCENKLIKKKLQQNYTGKKQFVKKYKKLSTIESHKESIKNLSLRESYAPGLQTNYNPLTTNHAFPRDREFLCKTDTKIERKTITAVKLHEKKRENSQKQKTSQTEKVEKRKQLIESLNLTRTKIRARIKTEAFENSKKTSKIKFKREDQIYSLKTEKIELNAQCRTQPDDIHSTKKKSQVNLTFNELKKESLSMLLTDTISIFKFKKDREKSVNRINHVKNISLETKKEWATSEAARKADDEREYLDKEMFPPDLLFSKAKHFQNFVNVKSAHNKFSRQLNSVYYHFPVL